MNFSQSQNDCWHSLIPGIKHQNIISLNKHISLTCFLTRMFQSILGHSSKKRKVHYSSRPTVSQLKGVFDTISNWFENHQPQRTISTITNAPFIQNSNQMASRLTTAAIFPSVVFELLQYSRQHPSFLAHRAALMTKTDLTYPAFSLRFVDFAVQFCFRCKFSFHEKWCSSQVWQWCDFPGPITVLCYA